MRYLESHVQLADQCAPWKFTNGADSVSELLYEQFMNTLGFCQVYVTHIEHVMENSSFCTIYKSSVSPGFAKHIMPTLYILATTAA
jgi:hypothetical protein